MLATSSWVNPAEAESLRRLFKGRTVWLASDSPRRREILKQCGIRQRVIGHGVDEPLPHGPNWRAWVRKWSLRKALSAAQRVPSGIVLAADTIVVRGKAGLGKPNDAHAAAAMLRLLSGRVHQVYTGVALIDAHTSRWASGSAISHVHFRRLGDAEIARYVRSGEPKGKAGAYAIQGEGGHLVDQIEGRLDNIIGLPVGNVERLTRRLLAPKRNSGN